ncbi:lauroyl-Kdo(2)-lipid IV(A) myristoyltransferase [Gallaecimonas kandeliae]|uniref:LpxL/LpxP family acyltransferase n=1 Tax=Gallaecimonas kandeliae TaxID=3029055 RepID=UPI0026496CCC|nr:lauroyl-Kdo(2)-lipid IV(A) myristoyltransferase [Gallaecimonas kandeliae]WKE65122.1 lauroyl-Kdo(2)-lipid IV(A) myristoyltransferase [Gallaecimonas kandeliae]
MSSDNSYNAAFNLKLLHPRYWGQWLAVFTLYLLTWLPVSAKNRLGAGLARWLCRRRLLAKRRQVMFLNLSRCFPEMPQAEQQALFEANVRAFCQTIMTLGELGWRSSAFLKRRLRIEDQGRLAQLLADGKPLIFLAPHTFALDWTARALILAGFNMCNIFKPTGKPVFDYMIFKSRTRQGGSQFSRGEGMGALVKAIRRGSPCLYVADEDLGMEASVFAPFFATEKCTLPALGRLAQASRATVVPLVAGYEAESGQFVLQVEPPLAALPVEDMASATVMNQAYEGLIQRFPADFMWSLKLLRNRDGSRPYAKG